MASTIHQNEPTLRRAHRMRREIIFAIALTIAATVYLLASSFNVSPNAPVVMSGAPQQIQ